MTSIAFVGDTHGHLKLMYEKLRPFPVDYVFQVGDLGVWQGEEHLDPRQIRRAERLGLSLEEVVGEFPSLLAGEWGVPAPTYFIRGNHEQQSLLLEYERPYRESLNAAVEVLPSLYYVPDSHIITIGKTRIAGWGGCWGEKTWEMDYWSETRAAPNREGWARRLNHMTRDRFERLRREHFDILVTHDAPIGVGLRGRGGPDKVGVPHIRTLIEEVQPQYHFCGHHHQYRENRIGRTVSAVLDRVDPGKPEAQCFMILEVE